MARIFEGVLAIWSDRDWPYERRGRLVFHADVAADKVYLRGEREGRWTSDELSWPLSDLVRRLFPQVAGAGAFFTRFFAVDQGALEPATVEFLQDASPMPGFISGLPKFDLEMPGISTIRYTKRCHDARFSPIAGTLVDLANVDFSDVHFKNSDLSGANTTGARFSRARFEDCRFSRSQLSNHPLDGAHFDNQRLEDLDFTGANLEGAGLGGTWFSRCTMNRAILRNAKVEKTLFLQCHCGGVVFNGATGSHLGFVECDLANATFDGANVDGWYFPLSTLAGTSFKDARLTNAMFTKLLDAYEAPTLRDVDLDNADLSGADFTGMSLVASVRYARPPRFGSSATSRTKLVRAAFKLSFLGKNASWVDATDATITYDVAPATGLAGFVAQHASFPKMEFASFNLKGADFSYARLPEAKFGNANLKDAKFNGAFLEGADFTSAKLDSAVFNNAVVTSANFSSAWLFESKFEQTTLAGTNFSSAMLVGVSFANLEGRSLSGVSFSSACLAQANFTSVQAVRLGSLVTSFSGACLAGTIFDKANLADVVLTNAQVSTAKGSLLVEVDGRAPKEVLYDPTVIEPSATGPQTTCPDGASGQCSVERLRHRAVKAKWPG